MTCAICLWNLLYSNNWINSDMEQANFWWQNVYMYIYLYMFILDCEKKISTIYQWKWSLVLKIYIYFNLRSTVVSIHLNWKRVVYVKVKIRCVLSVYIRCSVHTVPYKGYSSEDCVCRPTANLAPFIWLTGFQQEISKFIDIQIECFYKKLTYTVLLNYFPFPLFACSLTQSSETRAWDVLRNEQ